MAIRFVTGTDDRYFAQLFLLLGSLRRHSGDVRLHVCDFGLSAPYRDFLRGQGMLLDMPAGAGSPPHAWYYKGMVARYTDAFGDDPIVWLDLDMIALEDIRPLFSMLVADMEQKGQTIACTGGGTVSGQLNAKLAPRYAQLVQGKDGDFPYLNAGFWVCRSRDFLRRYGALCAQMPMELLFEQSAFILTAMEQPSRLRLLDLPWNTMNDALATMQLAGEGRDTQVITELGERIHLLHITSNNRDRDLVHQDLRFELSGYFYTCNIKLLRRPDLLPLQLGLITEGLQAYHQPLIGAGILLQTDLVASTP